MSLDWRRLPALSSLRAFEATARNGGFSGAGRALNVTHVAIAQQVRRLEAEVGAKLVVRTGRAVSLTEVGEQLARALSDGFKTIADGVQQTREQENRRGLRINTTSYIADAIILPRLAEFWAKHPGVEIAMHPSSTAADMTKDGFDLAVRGWSRDLNGMDAIDLTTSRVIVAGAPSLFESETPDLEDLPWIGTCDNTHEQEMMAAIGLDPERLRRVEVGSPHFELASARQGHGLILATEIIVRSELAEGLLVEIPTSGLPEICYCAVVPKGPRRPAVRQFLSWLKTIF